MTTAVEKTAAKAVSKATTHTYTTLGREIEREEADQLLTHIRNASYTYIIGKIKRAKTHGRVLGTLTCKLYESSKPSHKRQPRRVCTAVS